MRQSVAVAWMALAGYSAALSAVSPAFAVGSAGLEHPVFTLFWIFGENQHDERARCAHGSHGALREALIGAKCSHS